MLRVWNQNATNENWRSRAVDDAGNEIFLLPKTVVSDLGQTSDSVPGGGTIMRRKVGLSSGTVVQADRNGSPVPLTDAYDVWAVAEDLEPYTNWLLVAAAVATGLYLMKG